MNSSKGSGDCCDEKGKSECSEDSSDFEDVSDVEGPIEIKIPDLTSIFSSNAKVSKRKNHWNQLFKKYEKKQKEVGLNEDAMDVKEIVEKYGMMDNSSHENQKDQSSYISPPKSSTKKKGGEKTKSVITATSKLTPSKKENHKKPGLGLLSKPLVKRKSTERRKSGVTMTPKLSSAKKVNVPQIAAEKCGSRENLKNRSSSGLPQKSPIKNKSDKKRKPNVVAASKSPPSRKENVAVEKYGSHENHKNQPSSGPPSKSPVKNKSDEKIKTNVVGTPELLSSKKENGAKFPKSNFPVVPETRRMSLRNAQVNNKECSCCSEHMGKPSEVRKVSPTKEIVTPKNATGKGGSKPRTAKENVRPKSRKRTFSESGLDDKVEVAKSVSETDKASTIRRSPRHNRPNKENKQLPTVSQEQNQAVTVPASEALNPLQKIKMVIEEELQSTLRHQLLMRFNAQQQACRNEENNLAYWNNSVSEELIKLSQRLSLEDIWRYMDYCGDLLIHYANEACASPTKQEKSAKRSKTGAKRSHH